MAISYGFNYSDMFTYSAFIKWPGRASPHIHTPAHCFFFPFSTFLGYFQALEVCDNFIQLGVEIALNLQINFGKFDMILSSKN